jgi:hypothetical protein
MFKKMKPKEHFKRSNRVLRKQFSLMSSTHSSPSKRVGFLV